MSHVKLLCSSIDNLTAEEEGVYISQMHNFLSVVTVLNLSPSRYVTSDTSVSNSVVFTSHECSSMNASFSTDSI